MGSRSVVLALALAALLFPASARADDRRDDAKAQVEFGILMAQRGLWKEALYRWERAIQVDPAYPAAYNNLAVAYEQAGEFEKARQAYEKALELAPDNVQIQHNYDLFREINDRAHGSSTR